MGGMIPDMWGLLCFRVSEPRDLHYNMTLYDGADSAIYETEVGPQLVHTYSITNKGPSSITEAEAYFVWPSFTFDGMNRCTIFCEIF
jgi:hypothetical protein